ncbi:MAG: hypothetical protein JSW66_19190 [Phycisphaerales bacterium]|nr:MAG: hypothetical protein JSW66_19190 [Phycisphaerales bacterium]
MSHSAKNPRKTEKIIAAAVLALQTMLVAWPTCLHGQETVLFEEDFEDSDTRRWELEPGWAMADGMLKGHGHSWARPIAGPWQDFRLQFRLNLEQGAIHLVYRLNDTGRYFIGFHEYGSHLAKQYWPETFIDLLDHPVTARDLGRWYDIEIAGSGPTLRFLVDGELEWEYVDPDALQGGTFAFETLDDGAATIDEIRVLGEAQDTSSAWVRTGGPLGGLGYDVRMRPDHLDMMYVTDAWAGVFISDDSGRSWYPSNQGISTRTGESGDAIPVFSLTIDPHDNDLIWIGTQNVRGIFKSTDAGQTWVEKDNGVTEYEGITFRGFTVDPNSSDIVYAAAEMASFAWSSQVQQGREFDKTKGVVYKTVDGGENWTAVWRGNNLARYIWINPNNSNVLYISTGIFDREAANSDHTINKAGGEGVLKSIDAGQTWQHVNSGLSNLYVGTLFMHPVNPDVLLAGTGNNAYPDGGGIYLTTNGGASWQYVLANENINAVEFSLADPNIAYAGSAGAIYRSPDRGQTWTKVSVGNEGWGAPGVRAGFPIDFQVDPRDPNRIFANNYGGGNFLSIDGGQTWTVASDGYTGAQVRAIAVDPNNPAVVYAAARSGLFTSADGGDSWAGLNKPPAYNLEWNVVAVDPSNPQHVLAGNNWDPILLRSYDSGRTLEMVGQRLTEGMAWRVIAFAPSDSRTVYAGSSAFFSAGVFDDRMAAAGIYVSHDGGTTWNPANDTLSSQANVIDLAVDPGDPQTVYAATGSNGLLKSSDGGRTWKKMNRADSTAIIPSVAVNPFDSNVVYAGIGRMGLFRSDDGGTTWQLSMEGMPPEARISDIVFDPQNLQVVYVSDHFSGVYRSGNGGSTWRQVNSSLRTRAVNRLALSSNGLHLYAATEGEGVYRLDIDGVPPLSESDTEPAGGTN